MSWPPTPILGPPSLLSLLACSLAACQSQHCLLLTPSPGSFGHAHPIGPTHCWCNPGASPAMSWPPTPILGPPSLLSLLACSLAACQSQHCLLLTPSPGSFGHAHPIGPTHCWCNPGASPAMSWPPTPILGPPSLLSLLACSLAACQSQHCLLLTPSPGSFGHAHPIGPTHCWCNPGASPAMSWPPTPILGPPSLLSLLACSLAACQSQHCLLLTPSPGSFGHAHPIGPTHCWCNPGASPAMSWPPTPILGPPSLLSLLACSLAACQSQHCLLLTPSPGSFGHAHPIGPTHCWCNPGASPAMSWPPTPILGPPSLLSLLACSLAACQSQHCLLLTPSPGSFGHAHPIGPTHCWCNPGASPAMSWPPTPILGPPSLLSLLACSLAACQSQHCLLLTPSPGSFGHAHPIGPTHCWCNPGASPAMSWPPTPILGPPSLLSLLACSLAACQSQHCLLLTPSPGSFGHAHANECQCPRHEVFEVTTTPLWDVLVTGHLAFFAHVCKPHQLSCL